MLFLETLERMWSRKGKLGTAELEMTIRDMRKQIDGNNKQVSGKKFHLLRFFLWWLSLLNIILSCYFQREYNFQFYNFQFFNFTNFTILGDSTIESIFRESVFFR